MSSRHKKNNGAGQEHVESLGHYRDPGIDPMSPALAGGFFTTEPPGKPKDYIIE